MSGLQPGLALNEKQAGSLWPAPRAVWAGPLGSASVEDTLAGPGRPPTRMGGSGDRPAKPGQLLHGGRPAGHHPGGRWRPFSSWPATTPSAVLGTTRFVEPRFSHVGNGSNATSQGLMARSCGASVLPRGFACLEGSKSLAQCFGVRATATEVRRSSGVTQGPTARWAHTTEPSINKHFSPSALLCGRPAGTVLPGSSPARPSSSSQPRH